MFYMQFDELVLAIFSEFLSQFAELNVVIFNNLTSVRRTDPRINVTQLHVVHSAEKDQLLVWYASAT